MNATTDIAFEFVKRLSLDLAENNFDLPPFPDTALRVQSALNDSSVTIESLSKIVLSEPMLTARLLMIANSAMMRRGSSEITDTKIAISRIGLKMVYNVAVSLAAKDVFHAPAGSLLSTYLDGTRIHSIKVSALAYIIAKKAKSSVNPDEAMLAGLLHAIGKFYILAQADDFPELLDNEELLAGLLNEWHTGVGRAIVETWGFPEQIVVAVDEQELINRERIGPADIADIIIVANILAKTDKNQVIEQTELDQIPSLLRLKIDAETLQNLIQESDEEISSMIQALAG